MTIDCGVCGRDVHDFLCIRVTVVDVNRQGAPQVSRRKVCRDCIRDKASVMAAPLGRQIVKRSLLRIAATN
jgi:hypothetical protein